MRIIRIIIKRPPCVVVSPEPTPPSLHPSRGYAPPLVLVETAKRGWARIVDLTQSFDEGPQVAPSCLTFLRTTIAPVNGPKSRSADFSAVAVQSSIVLPD